MSDPSPVAVVERTRALAELVPQQPLAVALAAQAEALLWAGEVDQGTAVAQEAVDLAGVDPDASAESLAVLCRAEADRAERATRRARRTDDESGARLGELVATSDVARHPRRRALACTGRAELTRAEGERSVGPMARGCRGVGPGRRRYQEAWARWRLAWALVCGPLGPLRGVLHKLGAARRIEGRRRGPARRPPAE